MFIYVLGCVKKININRYIIISIGQVTVLVQLSLSMTLHVPTHFFWVWSSSGIKAALCLYFTENTVMFNETVFKMFIMYLSDPRWSVQYRNNELAFYWIPLTLSVFKFLIGNYSSACDHLFEGIQINGIRLSFISKLLCAAFSVIIPCWRYFTWRHHRTQDDYQSARKKKSILFDTSENDG